MVSKPSPSSTDTMVVVDRHQQHHQQQQQGGVFLPYPIESTLPSTVLRQLRFFPQFSLVVTQNILLAGAAIIDWIDYSHTDVKLITVTDLTFGVDPVRSIALGFFLVQLLLDCSWVFLAIWFGGMNKPQFKQLWPILSHHIGFCMLTTRVLANQLEYVGGLAFVGLLSEFAVPFKLYLAYHYCTSMESGNSEVSTMYQLRVHCLDMFFTGGATFAALSNYALIIGDQRGLLSRPTSRSYTIILTLAIVYWMIQLVGNHRARLERLMARLLVLQEKKADKLVNIKFGGAADVEVAAEQNIVR